MKLQNKILIVTAVWERHDLTEIVLAYYRKIAVKARGRIALLAVGSEGDVSETMCNKNGWRYKEAENLPVSSKWAALVKEARNIDFDFLIITGSDDLLCPSLIKYYDKMYSKNANYMLGLQDLYFYMMDSAKSYHFHGYPSMQTIGAGRCISRSILQRINWKPWSNHKINRGLDSCCSQHLRLHGVQERSVKMKDTGGVGIDIKHYKIAISDSARIIEQSTYSENILKQKFPTEYKELMELKY